MKFILLVEDDLDDEAPTFQRALKKNRIINEVIFASDEPDALDSIFGTGKHPGLVTSEIPQLTIFLNQQCPTGGRQ